MRRNLGFNYESFLLVEKLRAKSRKSIISDDLQLQDTKNITIGENVLIDKGCMIYCKNEGRVTLGNNAILGNNVKLYAGEGSIKIGDSCDIGLNVVFTTHSRDLTQNPLVDNSLHKHNLGEIVIGKGCFIGSNAVILTGTVLGDYCNVTAGSVVSGKYPENTTLVGNPARTLPRIEFDK